MTYVRNADLTIGHIKHLAFKCGYDLIDPTPGRDLICAVKTPSGEIVEFKSFPSARCFLKSDLKDIQAERRRAWKKLGIEIATKTLPYYYEHQLDVINDGSITNAANIYFGADLIQEYVILGHHTQVIEGRSVLIIWTPTKLSSKQQQDLLHDWRPVVWSVCNLKHNQSFAAFQTWYNAQDKQTQLDYWMVKRADLAAMQEREHVPTPEEEAYCDDHAYDRDGDITSSIPTTSEYGPGETVQIADSEHRYSGCSGVVAAVNGECITVELTFVDDTVEVRPEQLKPYQPEDWSHLERTSLHWEEERVRTNSLPQRNW